MSSSVGVALICACHRFGWPVAAGGSQSIADALASYVREHGGTIETGVRVGSLSELPPADAVVLDLAPRAVADIAGDRLPGRVARAYRRYRHGPGAFKVDLAVERRRAVDERAGPPRPARSTSDRPLRGDRRRRARRQPRAHARAPVRPGRPAVPRRPRRARRRPPPGLGLRPRPAAATPATPPTRSSSQIERFAPGLRERIVASSVSTPPASRTRTPTTSAATSSPAPTTRSRS